MWPSPCSSKHNHPTLVNKAMQNRHHHHRVSPCGRPGLQSRTSKPSPSQHSGGTAHAAAGTALQHNQRHHLYWSTVSCGVAWTAHTSCTQPYQTMTQQKKAAEGTAIHLEDEASHLLPPRPPGSFQYCLTAGPAQFNPFWHVGDVTLRVPAKLLHTAQAGQPQAAACTCQVGAPAVAVCHLHMPMEPPAATTAQPCSGRTKSRFRPN
jgi:hypothetical protein